MATYMYQQPMPMLPQGYDPLDPNRRMQMYPTNYVSAQQVMVPNPAMQPVMMNPGPQYAQQPQGYMQTPAGLVPMMPQQHSQMMPMSPSEISSMHYDGQDRRYGRQRSGSMGSQYSYVGQQIPHSMEYPNNMVIFDYRGDCHLCLANHPHPHLQHRILRQNEISRHSDQMSQLSGLSDLNLSNRSSSRQGAYDAMDWPLERYLLEGRDSFDRGRGRNTQRSRSTGRYIRERSNPRIQTLDMDSDSDVMRDRDLRSRNEVRLQGSFARSSSRYRDELDH